MLNLISLLCGILAWAVPIRALRGKTYLLPAIISLSLCATSIALQIFEIRSRVHVNDWSALMDTIDVLSFVVVVQLSVSILLNVLLYYKSKTTA